MEQAKETMTEVGSFFSNVKERLHVDEAINAAKDSKDYLIDISMFAGVGFVSGFLIKRYSTYLLVIIFAGLFLALLQYLDIVHVFFNTNQIKTALGVDASLLNDDNVMGVISAWAKHNVYLVISFVVGFLLGLRCA